MSANSEQPGLSLSPLAARLLLLGLVLAVVAHLLLREDGRQQAADPAPAGVVTTAVLADRILNRFAAAPGSGSIVHEVVSFDGPLLDVLRHETAPPPLRMERWYDYGPPVRLRLEVFQGDRRVYAVWLDEQRRLLIDLDQPGFAGSGIRARGTSRVTTLLSPEEVERYLPVLRQPYANGSLFATFPTLPPPVQEILLAAQLNPAYADGLFLAPFFSLPPALLDALAIVRSDPSALQPLGAVSALGRPAWRVAVYGERANYLLTIDQESYAIIDLAPVLPGGQQAARSPWQTTTLEVLSSAPADIFRIPSDAVVLNSGPIPPPWFWNDSSRPHPQRTAELPPFTLLLPDTSVMSDSLGSIVWSAPPNISIQWYAVTTLWSEYGLAMIVQLPRRGGRNPLVWTDREGNYAFELLPPSAQRERRVGLYAMVNGATLPTEETLTRLYIALYLPLASPAEREAVLRHLIRTLEPADAAEVEDYWLFQQVTDE